MQQAVHPDALTIFGATFDETLDDEIRVTVIATGFDKAPDSVVEPKVVSPVQAAPAGKVLEPIDAEAEIKKAEEDDEDDVFGDILKIFNKRD